MLATPPIAGATIFDNTGQAIAPVTPPATHPYPISLNVASAPLSAIGCTAPNQAQTTPDRRASEGIVFAPAKYPPPIGAVKASSQPNCLISICF